MEPRMVPPPPKRSFVKRFWPVLPLALLGLGLGGYADHRAKHPKITTILPAPLPPAFETLPVGSVKPLGWLKQQMQLQASGLTGHLDEFWPDISQSGWIGGKGEGWERAPYWLDGLVPLAFELDDPALKQKARRWVDYILAHQSPDGWLGPDQGASNYGFQLPPNPVRDPWPQFVILKALAQYAEATGDPRVMPAMARDLANLDQQLDRRPLFDWSFFRWGDLLVTLDWMAARTGDPRWPRMEAKAAAQGYGWAGHFADFHERQKTVEWNFLSHGVNNAMGLKVPALLYRLTGQPVFRGLAHQALADLDRWHGEPNGLFSADECLAGKSPSQGTELCAVVEEMFSLETDLTALGDPVFADRVEKIAFNALPAAFTPDYWRHQYDQQANQVACVFSSNPVYTTNRGAANFFGLEPQYGCCTANLHQGWPKFASHLWVKTPDGGLAAALYAPSVVETVLDGKPLRVELDTDYPFSETLTFQVDCPRGGDFPLYFRVPGWCGGASLKMPDGSLRPMKRGSFNRIQRHWSGRETLVLTLPMGFTLARGDQGSASLDHGPLVFSLGLPPDWKKALPFRFEPKGKKMWDEMAIPLAPWNYALQLDPDHLGSSLTFRGGPLKGNPFTLEGAPVSVTVQARRLENWGFDRGAADPPPPSPVESAAPLETLVLVPYGSTRLRVTEFPLLK